MPLDTTTPSRSGGTSGAPASAHASRAATRANCSHRSSRRACTRSSTVAGSTAAGAAIRAGRLAYPSPVSARAPLRPASIPSQVLATSPPSGVVAPRPVTTTRGWSARTIISSFAAVPPRTLRRRGKRLALSGRDLGAADVLDDVLDGLEVLQLVVGDLHAELVLGRHRDLDHRQRVDVQVVHEALVRGDFVRGDARDLVDDLPEAGLDFRFAHCHGMRLLRFLFLGWACAGRSCPGTWARSGYLEHLSGVADARAEAPQQDRVAGGDLTALDHAAQRERERRGRGVARVH